MQLFANNPKARARIDAQNAEREAQAAAKRNEAEAFRAANPIKTPEPSPLSAETQAKLAKFRAERDASAPSPEIQERVGLLKAQIARSDTAISQMLAVLGIERSAVFSTEGAFQADRFEQLVIANIDAGVKATIAYDKAAAANEIPLTGVDRARRAFDRDVAKIHARQHPNRA